MRKETLKHLLELKLEIVETLVADMPIPVQTAVVEIERDFMTALHEVTAAYLEAHPEPDREKTENTVQSINID